MKTVRRHSPSLCRYNSAKSPLNAPRDSCGNSTCDEGVSCRVTQTSKSRKPNEYLTMRFYKESTRIGVVNIQAAALQSQRNDAIRPRGTTGQGSSRGQRSPSSSGLSSTDGRRILCIIHSHPTTSSSIAAISRTV